MVKSLNRFVVANGEKIEYQLTRKNVKNINMRIKSDNIIAVSAGRRVPLDVIEQFIISKADWIYAAKQRVLAKQDARTENHLYFLGERLNIIYQDAAANNIEIIGSNLIVSSSVHRQNGIIINSWLNKQSAEIFSAIFDKVFEIFSGMVDKKPHMKIRNMKSRWGVCHTVKNTITLNSRLIHYPVCAIEYVVVHEFAHLLVPNHSQQFYGVVEKILPDYKQRRSILKHSPLG